MAYRLFAVESEQAAAAFVFQEYPQLAEKSLTFQPRAAPPGRYAGDDAEALVLVADDARPGMVYVSSFEDPGAAQSFLRFEEQNGLDMSLVKTYWGVPRRVAPAASVTAEASPVEIRDAAAGIQRAGAVPVKVGVAHQIEPVTRASSAPPVKAPADREIDAGRESIVDSIRNWPGWPTLRGRMTAAAVLNNDVLEAIRKDPIAISQARAIVAATAATAAVGVFWFGPLAIISYAVLSLVGWLAGAHLTYWMGTKLFPGRRSADTREWLFKSLAFAQAPRLLLVVGLALPGFWLLLALAAFVWALAASVPAVEETLEIDNQSALLAAMSGWLAMFALAVAAPLAIV